MKVKTLFWKKIFFNSGSDFAKSRSAIRIYSVSPKAVMIKQCNAITRVPSQLNMDLICIAKAAKIKMTKNWIGKINKITKKTVSRELSQTNRWYGLFNLTWKRRCLHFILHVVVISGTDLESLIAVISSTLQKLSSRIARLEG